MVGGGVGGKGVPLVSGAPIEPRAACRAHLELCGAKAVHAKLGHGHIGRHLPWGALQDVAQVSDQPGHSEACGCRRTQRAGAQPTGTP